MLSSVSTASKGAITLKGSLDEKGNQSKKGVRKKSAGDLAGKGRKALDLLKSGLREHGTSGDGKKSGKNRIKTKERKNRTAKKNYIERYIGENLGSSGSAND